MKLLMTDIQQGTVNVKKVAASDMQVFCDEHDLKIDCQPTQARKKRDILNDIVDAVDMANGDEPVPRETEPEPAPEPIASANPVYKKAKPEPKKRKAFVMGEKRGKYGLGYRKNGEHICPTHDGSPDKGSNDLNRGST